MNDIQLHKYLSGYLDVRSSRDERKAIQAVAISWSINSWICLQAGDTQYFNFFSNFYEDYNQDRLISEIKNIYSFTDLLQFCRDNKDILSECICKKISNFTQLSSTILLNRISRELRSAIFLHGNAVLLKYNSSGIEDPIMIPIYEENGNYFPGFLKNFDYENTGSYQRQVKPDRLLNAISSTSEEVFLAFVKGMKYIIRELPIDKVWKYIEVLEALKSNHNIASACRKLIDKLKKRLTSEECKSHRIQEFPCRVHHCYNCIVMNSGSSSDLKCPCGKTLSSLVNNRYRDGDNLVSLTVRHNSTVVRPNINAPPNSGGIPMPFQPNSPYQPSPINPPPNSSGIRMHFQPEYQPSPISPARNANEAGECVSCNKPFRQSELTNCGMSHFFCKKCATKNGGRCYICCKYFCSLCRRPFLEGVTVDSNQDPIFPVCDRCGSQTIRYE